MATVTEGGDGAPTALVGLNDHSDEMKRCKRCELTYQPSKSSSALKLTYCSFFCELGDLGFSMDSLERMESDPEGVPVEPETEQESETEPEPAEAS